MRDAGLGDCWALTRAPGGGEACSYSDKHENIQRVETGRHERGHHSLSARAVLGAASLRDSVECYLVAL